MKPWKKELLKEWWNNNLDYLPLGSRWRGLWQKKHVTNIIRELDERRLDIDIAEKVFGYKINVGTLMYYEEFGGQVEYPELQYLVEVYSDGSDESWKALPNYSTDIADAFLIVEELRDNQTCIAVETTSDNSYVCEVIYNDTIVAYIKRKTASEAICSTAIYYLNNINET